MRVVITGAGLVGCHTAAELRSRGDEVTILDLAPDDAYVARVAGEGVRTERADIRSLPALVASFESERPDVVVHTVGLIGAVAQSSPFDTFEVNVAGTINAIEAAHRVGARRFVHASTLGVLRLAAPQHGPIDEDFPIGRMPRMYPSTKVACEAVLPAFAEAYGIQLAMLRFGMAYGLGHFSGGSGIGISVHELASAAVEGREVEVAGRIMETLDLVYAKDLGRGVALAVHAPELQYDTYHISGGELATGRDVADTLARIVPGFSAGIPDREIGTERKYPMDLSRARSVLGYEPAYDLEAGLRDYVAALRGSSV